LKQKNQAISESKKNSTNDNISLQQQLSQKVRELEETKFNAERKERELENKVVTLKKEIGMFFFSFAFN
jgi:hypothetical protein